MFSRRSLKPSRSGEPDDEDVQTRYAIKTNGTGPKPAAVISTTKKSSPFRFLCIALRFFLVFHMGVVCERRKYYTGSSQICGGSISKEKNGIHGIANAEDYDGPPADLVVQGNRTFFTPIPDFARRMVNIQGKGGTTIKSSFVHMGWIPTSNISEAHIVYRAKRYTNGKDKINVKLQPWQRYSRLTGSDYWESKGGFAKGFAAYQQQHPDHDLHFLPETYRLADPRGRRTFEERLTNGGGMNEAWVLKTVNVNNGRGIEILGPNSEALRTAVARTLPNGTARNNTRDADKLNANEGDVNVTGQESGVKTTTGTKDATTVTEKEPLKEFIVQKYICNELTWFHGEKFDLRMFWAVASVDPPIVMYHDGFVRASVAKYNESDFSDSAHHLTNQQFRSQIETSVSDSDLWERVQQHYDHEVNIKGNSDLQRRARDRPVVHVKKQMMESIGTLYAAFKDVFGTPPVPGSNSHGPDNFFAVYGCDFIIDNDLDVYFIESQASPGFGRTEMESRVDIFRRIYRPLPGIIEAIALAQEANASANIMPILTRPVLGDYELVYAGDWQYKYLTYQRPSTKKPCAVAGSSP